MFCYQIVHCDHLFTCILCFIQLLYGYLHTTFVWSIQYNFCTFLFIQLLLSLRCYFSLFPLFPFGYSCRYYMIIPSIFYHVTMQFLPGSQIASYESAYMPYFYRVPGLFFRLFWVSVFVPFFTAKTPRNPLFFVIDFMKALTRLILQRSPFFCPVCLAYHVSASKYPSSAKTGFNRLSRLCLSAFFHENC